MREIEMPLVFVLSDMEQDGICIDAPTDYYYGMVTNLSSDAFTIKSFSMTF